MRNKRTYTSADLPPKRLQELLNRIKMSGVSYKPCLLPPDVLRGEVKHCYDVSVMRALESNGKYHYVEGMVILWDGREVLHAWLTDDEGENAYDPTWKAFGENDEEVPVPGIYIGFELDVRVVAEFMVKTHYQGLLPNGYLAPEIFEYALPEFGPPVQFNQ